MQKPIAYSNVALIDPVTKAACRSSWRYLEDGTKVSVHVSSSFGCNNCIIKLHGCYSTQAICSSMYIAAYACALTAGPHHMWQASIGVSHTAACTLGPSQPNKKLCRYVSEKRTCWVQYCATLGFLSLLLSFLELLSHLWLYYCRQEGYGCNSGTSYHTC